MSSIAFPMALLAQRAGDVIFGAAVARLALAAGQIHLRPSISPRRRCRGSCLPCSPCSGRACRRRPCSPARRWPKPDRPCARSPSGRAWPASTGFRRHPWWHPWRACSDPRWPRCGLFRVGSIDLDFSHSFPISLIRPGFSGCAGCAERRRSFDSAAARAAGRGPIGHRLLGRRLHAERRRRRRRLRPAGVGGERPTSTATTPAVATCVLRALARWPVRSGMVRSVTRSRRRAKPFRQMRASQTSLNRDDESEHQHDGAERDPQAKPLFQFAPGSGRRSG